MGKAVLVTTEWKGVFFGYLESKNGRERSVALTQARNCLSWSAVTRGFLGLAVYGPNDECRVGPAAETLELFGVTGIAGCSDAAVEAWEKAPW